MVGHIPFAASLMCEVSPKTLVKLGTHAEPHGVTAISAGKKMLAGHLVVSGSWDLGNSRGACMALCRETGMCSKNNLETRSYEIANVVSAYGRQAMRLAEEMAAFENQVDVIRLSTRWRVAYPLRIVL